MLARHWRKVMVCLNVGAYNIQAPMFLPYRKVRILENFPHKTKISLLANQFVDVGIAPGTTISMYGY